MKEKGFTLTEVLVVISIIAILIIFHPEIRQGLARLGRRQLFSSSLKTEEELSKLLKEILDAAEGLIREKIGALIAIERFNPGHFYSQKSSA